MLITLLLISAVGYGAGVSRLWRKAGVGQGVGRGDVAAFAAGIVALLVALVGLHELSEQLLAAHMVQHELLMIVAAPLVALGSPILVWLWLLPSRWRPAVMAAARQSGVVAVFEVFSAPVAVWLLHGAALWVWHLPSLYQAAIRNEAVHITQHLSFFLTAVLFWSGLTRGRYGRAGYGAAVLFVFATSLHSGVLGALLTFSRNLWYPLYGATSPAFGLTALEDQQVAGLVMWIPAGIILTIGGLVFLAAWLRESERRARCGGEPSPRRMAATHGPISLR
jgi:putative membrane protein